MSVTGKVMSISPKFQCNYAAFRINRKCNSTKIANFNLHKTHFVLIAVSIYQIGLKDRVDLQLAGSLFFHFQKQYPGLTHVSNWKLSLNDLS